MDPIHWSIQRIPGDPIELTLKSGDQLFVVGRNGSGKSALIQQFVSENTDKKIKRLTAHRQIWLESGVNSLTPAGRQNYQANMRNYEATYQARWKDSYAEQNLSLLLFDLFDKENIINKSIAQQVRNEDMTKAAAISDGSPSPFDQINELLGLSKLEITIENSDDQSLLARHSRGELFSIAEMSDGERSAMIIAAHVITADPGTVFLIDEPERHLHRSIIQPFLSALFDLRKEDCIFIVASHELTLPVANPEAQVIILRSCQWSDNQCQAWEAEILESNSQLPEELKLAILGSRRRILFVEGTSNSLDFPIYTALFPDLSVVPKGSCEEVQKAVFGLRDSVDIHHVEAFGLIDRDDRTDERVKKLEEKGVFALEVYSAEALYYCSDAITTVACRQAESLGEEANKFIESAKQKAIQVIEEEADRMVARRCERRTRELLLSEIPDWKSIKDNPTQPICVSADSPYPEEHNRFKEHVQRKELDQLIARYPVRESPIFETIARSLKCSNKTDYERMVIARVQCDDGLVEKLKKRIGPLSKILDREQNQ